MIKLKKEYFLQQLMAKVEVNLLYLPVVIGNGGIWDKHSCVLKK